MCSAVKYCIEAGLSRRLSEELKSADIVGQYELFVRSAPWKYLPATLTLKKIYAHWKVEFYSSAYFALN